MNKPLYTLGYNRVTSKEKMPEEEHYAVLIFSSHTHYSADPYETTTVETVEYLSFLNEDGLKQWIAKEETSTGQRTKYCILRSKPIVPVIKVDVKF